MSTNSEAVSQGNPPRPCDPQVARAPIYYGWVMLPVAMLAQILTVPGQTIGISVFTGSLTESLGITETQLTGAYGLGTLLACLPLTLVGGLMDRYGIRRSMVMVVLALGGACLFVSRVSDLWTLFAAFFLLRFLGQGALSLLAGNTPAMWFHQRLGTVTGLMNVGVVLVMGQWPLLIRLLVDNLGWRGAYVALGLLVWGLMLPVLALLFRNRPEDMGLLPDGRGRIVGGSAGTGGHGEAAGQEASTLKLNTDLDLRGALATRGYRLMLLIYVAWAVIGTALVFNAHKLFAIQGLSVSQADWGLTAFFSTMALAQLVGGILSDRVPPRFLVAVAVAGMTTAIGLLLLGRPIFMLPAYMLFGAGQGMLGSSSNTLWVRYYGRGHLGKIRGTVQTVAVAGSALGPFLMGWSFDTFGGYELSLWVFLIVLAGLVPAGWLASAPVRTFPVRLAAPPKPDLPVAEHAIAVALAQPAPLQVAPFPSSTIQPGPLELEPVQAEPAVPC